MIARFRHQIVVIVATVLVFSVAKETLAQHPGELGPTGGRATCPAVISADGGAGYYVFSSGPGITIWHSEDLTQWKAAGRVFEEVPAWAKELIPGADWIWAPDIRRANDRYFLYYCVSTIGSQRSVIGLVTNSTLDRTENGYRWVDQGLVIESLPDRNDYNAIDPSFFVDKDERAYLFWGSFWTGVKALEVDLATGKPASNPARVVAIARRRETAPPAIEAPHLVRRGKYYYLFVSWDFDHPAHLDDPVDNRSYKIMVGRSKSPLGPYVDDAGRKMSDGGGRILLMGDSRWQGPGHNSVLQTRDGDWIAYHVIDAEKPQQGRVLQLRPLKWERGWPIAGQPLGLPTDGSRRMPLVGRWVHSVGNQNPTEIFLEANGLINGVWGEARWSLSDHDLVLKWKDRNAPDGYWTDRVVVSRDGTRYLGKNQNGNVIRGRLIQPAPQAQFRRRPPGN